jgi:hypothetical protein
MLGPVFGGSPFLRIVVEVDGRRVDMFVDECGGLKRLQRNMIASNLYAAAYLRANPDSQLDTEAELVCGPAALFDRIVWSETEGAKEMNRRVAD